MWVPCSSRWLLWLTIQVLAVASDLHPSEHTSSPPKYSLTLTKTSRPALSIANAVGQGHSPCELTFNPAWIQASQGTGNKTGVLVRVAKCPEVYGGEDDHIMMAYCDNAEACSDLEATLFDFEAGAQDPRVVYNPSTGMYTLWYYAYGQDMRTVYVRESPTPFDASSWKLISKPQAWHRNGCAFPSSQADTKHGQYILFGEAPPLEAIGLARSFDAFRSYQIVNKSYIRPTGAEDQKQPEVVVEASTPVVALSSGDYLHLYSAGTPGWVEHGNYTAGFVIIDGKDPNRIIQRSEEHFLIASTPYEGVPPLEGYPVNRYRTTFVTSIVPVQGLRDTFRLWWGAADASVATGMLTVKISDPDHI